MWIEEAKIIPNHRNKRAWWLNFAGWNLIIFYPSFKVDIFKNAK